MFVFNLGFTLLKRPVFIVESTVAAEGVSLVGARGALTRPQHHGSCRSPSLCVSFQERVGFPLCPGGQAQCVSTRGSRGAWRGGPRGSQGSTHSRPPAYTHLTLRCLHRPCGWAAYAHVPERSRQPGRAAGFGASRASPWCQRPDVRLLRLSPVLCFQHRREGFQADGPLWS